MAEGEPQHNDARPTTTPATAPRMKVPTKAPPGYSGWRRRNATCPVRSCDDDDDMHAKQTASRFAAAAVVLVALVVLVVVWVNERVIIIIRSLISFGSQAPTLVDSCRNKDYAHI